MNNRLTPRQWQLLSAYLDNQLKAKEKRQVEQLLQQDPDAREALESLRRTRIVLRATPKRRAPRNFTLSGKSVRKPVIPTFTTVLRYASALAATLLIFVFVLDFIGFALPPAAERLAADQSMLAMEAPAQEKAAQPPIILWGPPSPMGGYGKGGATGIGGGGAEGPAYGIGGGPPASEAAPSIEAAPESGEELPTPEITPTPEPLSGSGPILGVQPSTRQGEVRIPPGEEVSKPGFVLPVKVTTLEIILGILFIALAVPAWLIRRK